MNPRGPTTQLLRRSAMSVANEYGVPLTAGTGERFTVARAHCMCTRQIFPNTDSDYALMVLVSPWGPLMQLEWGTICNLLSIGGKLPSRANTRAKSSKHPDAPTLAKWARDYGLSVSVDDDGMRIGALRAKIVPTLLELPADVDILVSRNDRKFSGLLDYVTGCKLLAIAGLGTQPRRTAPPRYVMWRDQDEAWIYMERSAYEAHYMPMDERMRPAIEYLADTEEECIREACRLHGRPHNTEGTDIEPETEPAKDRKCPTCKGKFRSVNGARYCPACVRAAQSIHEESIGWQWPSMPGGVYR